VALAREGRLAYQLAAADPWTSNFASYHQLGGGGGGGGSSDDGGSAMVPTLLPPVRTHAVRHGFPQDAAHCQLVATAIADDCIRLGWLDQK
jgi:hypothetical protein